MRRSEIHHGVFLILACAIATGCSDRASGRSLSTIAKAWPKVDGSTSTEPLAVLIASKAHGLPYDWSRGPAEERTVVPSGQMRPALAARIVREVHHHGTHDAYTELIDRRVDLILVAREPSTRERAAAARAGVVLDVRPFALDALVFVVNARNPVRDLPLERLRAVYGPGGTERWTELGGGEGTIEAFQREEDSGSQELIDQLVMRGLPMRDVQEVPIVRTMAGPINAVARRKAGLAFSVYYYVTNMARNGSVRMLGVDGVRPTRASIASRIYPLTTPVFAVLRQGTDPESPAAKLRDWLGTEDGRDAILESGYAPWHDRSHTGLRIPGDTCSSVRPHRVSIGLERNDGRRRRRLVPSPIRTDRFNAKQDPPDSRSSPRRLRSPGRRAAEKLVR